MKAINLHEVTEKGLFDDLADYDVLEFYDTKIIEGNSIIPSKANLIFTPALAEVADIFSAAKDKNDINELLGLFIGRVESTAPSIGHFSKFVEIWKKVQFEKRVSENELLSCQSIAPFLKSIFDFFFRSDLYGFWKQSNPIILSSGSFDETSYGLPDCLKLCLGFAIDRNWYGYSDSLGRASAREAIAEFEKSRYGSDISITSSEIAITLGGTMAVASLADFFSLSETTSERVALCGIPNYPPLIASISKRYKVQLVPTPTIDHYTDIGNIISLVKTETPKLILLQTVTNPTGLRVPESQIEELIKNAPHDCYIILDECHDFFGPSVQLSGERRKPNVITVNSISKLWAAPGLKIGWFVANSAIVDEFYEYASTIYGGPTSLTFLLLEIFSIFETARRRGVLDTNHALSCLPSNYGLNKQTLLRGFANYVCSYTELQKKVQRVRTIATDGLLDAGFKVLLPDYSINILTQFGKKPSYNIYRDLIQNASVSVYPGLLCGCGVPGLVRISPCIPEPILIEAISRIKKWSYHQNSE